MEKLGNSYNPVMIQNFQPDLTRIYSSPITYSSSIFTLDGDGNPSLSPTSLDSSQLSCRWRRMRTWLLKLLF